MIIGTLRLTKKYTQIQTKRNILLTGIQPTGDLHIGNYLGAVSSILRLQKQKQHYDKQYLMIADYHALTTAITNQHGSLSINQTLANDTLSMARVLIAAGIDPKQMCLFVQSQVPAHCELAWVFSCLGPQFWLNTMIQYKEKAHENSSVGLLTYPILMAVDILLYQANHVPVGVDQVQHIELTNKYAERFNKLSKSKFFPKVNYLESQFPKVMSLVNPEKKMSKSESNLRSRILLTDSKELVREKIRRAVTDSDGKYISFDPHQRPGLSNLIQIYSAFTDKDIETTVQELQNEGVNIAELKERLSRVVGERLEQIQTRLAEISNEQVRKVLEEGRENAQNVAEKNIKQVKELLNIYT